MLQERCSMNFISDNLFFNYRQLYSLKISRFFSFNRSSESVGKEKGSLQIKLINELSSLSIFFNTRTNCTDKETFSSRQIMEI
jgi:hypothetical protein